MSFFEFLEMEISTTQPIALRNICNFGLYELHSSVNLSDDVNTVSYPERMSLYLYCLSLNT